MVSSDFGSNPKGGQASSLLTYVLRLNLHAPIRRAMDYDMLIMVHVMFSCYMLCVHGFMFIAWVNMFALNHKTVRH